MASKWTVEEMKLANEKAGRFFFSEGSVSFFSSLFHEIKEGVAGVFFVTSEKDAWVIGSDRLYTIRRFDPDTGLVTTVGRFQQYKSQAVAEERMRVLADNYVEGRDYGV